MKKLLLTITLIFAFTFAQAQNDMKARIEFEEAEKAYEGKDYDTALKYLNEAEKLIGKWTPLTSYLKIESLYAITDMSNAFDENMQPLYTEVEKYMNHMNKLNSNEVPTEKYKSVYAIEKVLKGLRFEERQSSEFIKAKNEKDDKVSIALYKPLAEKGNSWAIRNIGVSHENLKELDQTFLWYKKAVESGNAQAALDLSRLDFIGGKDEARKWYEKAAKLGHPYGVFMQGWYAENTDNNIQKAMEYYQQAADLGSVGGFNYIGEIYREGKGVPKDSKKAESYYLKAAKKKDGGFAMCQIGTLYHNGENGIIQNHKTAMDWYLKAVEKKNTEAMRYIGWIYQHGQGGYVKDYNKAEQWYQKALGNSKKYEYVHLGNLYSIADNYQPEKALENYVKAADVGYSEGMIKAADFYFTGKDGIAKDYAKAAKYYESYYNNEKKIDVYLDNLIVIYNRGGYGVEKDKEKAKKWKAIRWGS